MLINNENGKNHSIFIIDLKKTIEFVFLTMKNRFFAWSKNTSIYFEKKIEV